MAKSALMAMLRLASSIAQTSSRTGIPADELLDMLGDRTGRFRTTRRRFLQGGLAATSAIAAAAFPRESDRVIAQSTGRAPILIVGAGLAGLTAAYRLRQSGVRADIVEATGRIGGRVRTQPKAAGTPIFVDLGGEFIDTSHTTLIGLATELGLRAVDLIQAQQGLVQDVFYFQNRRIRLERIISDFAPLAQKINADLAVLGDEISYESSSEFAQEIDNLSIAEYLEQIEISSVLRQLIRIAYTTEYGRDSEEQSALNLLFLIGTDTNNNFSIYGESDERYQIEGGNIQIINGLANAVADSIETNTILEAITTLPDGRYRVSLRAGQSVFDRTYERVLLTLPFTVLRQTLLNVRNFRSEKREAINELGYGTNSKLVTGYRSRVWREAYRSTASVYADLEFQNTWEATPFAPTTQGLVTEFTGGRQGLVKGGGTPEDQAQRFLADFDRVFPGVKNARIGKALRAYWPGERFFLGSYACYLIGQWTQMRGVEGQREGNLFFAGEHTSLDYQGYMEGASETGERAAIEILDDLGLRAAANSLKAKRLDGLQRRRTRFRPRRGSLSL